MHAHALREELEDDAEGADAVKPTAAFRIGEQVEVRLQPPASKDGTSSSSGLAPRWVPAVVCEFDTSKGDLRYVCHLPADYEGKTVRRSQTFNADDVKKVAGATFGVERSPAKDEAEAAQEDAGSAGACTTYHRFGFDRYDYGSRAPHLL